MHLINSYFGSNGRRVFVFLFFRGSCYALKSANKIKIATMFNSELCLRLEDEIVLGLDMEERSSGDFWSLKISVFRS
jgi:hypothetical protein